MPNYDSENIKRIQQHVMYPIAAIENIHIKTAHEKQHTVGR